jgi:hypothetical protein
MLLQMQGAGSFVVAGADETTAAGVCAGDVLFSIDRVLAAGLEGEDVARMLRGRRGA